MSSTEVVCRLIDEIKSDARSARHHPRKQIKQIAQSIEASGFVNPILIDDQDKIIAGNGRLLAAKELGLAHVPTITLHGLDPVQQRLLSLADNKLAEGSSWNTDLLRAQLESLTKVEVDYNIELSGFSNAEIEFAVRKRRGDVEETPQVQRPARPVTEVGDIWLLGEHRLACGDCRSQATMANLMDGKLADAAFLDPPYNVPISGFVVSRDTHEEFAMASGEMSKEEFVAFLIETLTRRSHGLSAWFDVSTEHLAPLALWPRDAPTAKPDTDRRCGARAVPQSH